MEEGVDFCFEDIFVDVASYYDLVSFIEPGLEFRFKVFEESGTRAAVIVDALEVFFMLLIDCFLAFFVVGRTVEADAAEDDAILTSVSRPGPLTKLGFIGSSTHGEV